MWWLSHEYAPCMETRLAACGGKGCRYGYGACKAACNAIAQNTPLCLESDCSFLSFLPLQALCLGIFSFVLTAANPSSAPLLLAARAVPVNS